MELFLESILSYPIAWFDSFFTNLMKSFSYLAPSTYALYVASPKDAVWWLALSITEGYVAFDLFQLITTSDERTIF